MVELTITLQTADAALVIASQSIGLGCGMFNKVRRERTGWLSEPKCATVIAQR